MESSEDELSLCPGFGPQKAQRLNRLIHEPFIKTKKTKSSQRTEEAGHCLIFVNLLVCGGRALCRINILPVTHFWWTHDTTCQSINLKCVLRLIFKA